MQVFVTGASGYIGFAVACAFRRAGHRVMGLIRRQEKAAQLWREEIEPLPGNLHEPDSYREAAAACDLIVLAAADYQTDSLALDLKTIEILESDCRIDAPPKTLIYTSGVWVYGDTGASAVDESSPLNPPAHVARRPQVEQRVLGMQKLQGLVVRPGCVYGRSGSLTNMWMEPASHGKAVEVIGDGRNHWAMVHVDDLAEGYLLAGEKKLSGTVINFVDASRNTTLEMAQAVARVCGVEDAVQHIALETAAGRMSTLAECLSLDQHVVSGVAEKLLNWKPRRHGFIAGIETYYRAWLAYQVPSME